MNFREYQLLAAITRNNNAPVIVALMGLLGEFGEALDNYKKVIGHGHQLDKDYLTKEFGDVFWYIAEVATYYDIELPEQVETLDSDRPVEHTMLIFSHLSASTALELVEIPLLINQDTVYSRLVTFISVLKCICGKLGLDVEDILQKNIAKLSTRYPQGFSEYHSRNRIEYLEPLVC